MTCKHDKADRSCTSHPDNYENQRYRDELAAKEAEARLASLAKEAMPATPDSEKYSIEEAVPIGNNLVLKVLYPNCKKCAHEGNKVMVYLGVTPVQALKWKKIDPHFRGPVRNDKEAPSPAARFPASPEGWKDALDFAKAKQ